MSPDGEGEARRRRRAALGTVVFVALVPGTVVGWAPYAITGWELEPPLLGLEATRWLGVAGIAASLPVFVDFCVRFVLDGLGTPAPVAEPERLVVSGAFRYVRNPGYVAVVGTLVGQALLFGSWAALAYACAVAAGFHAFVVLYEEPHLREKFGDTYAAYCERVPRWLPRRRRS